MSKSKSRPLDEPNMSDRQLLVTVEDLIYSAMGPKEANTVNFKILRSILILLARQLRFLQQKVDIVDEEMSEDSMSGGQARKSRTEGKRKEVRGKKETVAKPRAMTPVRGERGKDGEDGSTDRNYLSEIDAAESDFKDGKERAGASRTGNAAGMGQRYSDSSVRIGSIEMVTQSEFRRVEGIVKALLEITGPIPFPTFPDNKKLREDIAKGTATLTDSMEAMQVVSRVEAAEAAVGRMADILTQLAVSGALPKDIAGKAMQIQADVMQIAKEKIDEKGTDLKGSGAKRTHAKGKETETVVKGEKASKSADGSKTEMKTSSASPKTKYVVIDISEGEEYSKHRLPSSKTSSSAQAELSAASRSAGWLQDGNVTYEDMDRALQNLKSDMNKKLENLTARATTQAEKAFANVKMISEKMATCEQLNNKISKLYELVTDYSEQLSGLDSGLTLQLQGFKDIMTIMREDLKNGLNFLEQVNNDAETAALKELMERHQEMVLRLDETLYLHQGLSAHQKDLSEQLRGLVECLEALREQKADCEEVYDGLSDKADLSRLAGMLTGEEFENVRRQLDGRLDLCTDKFNRQDQTWMGALGELALIVDEKAPFLDLLGARNELQSRLHEIQHAIHLLTERIGDPKAAVLMRKLATGASCAACKVPALMEPVDAAHGAPISLPAARPVPLGASADPEAVEFCLKPKIDQTGDTHFCRRWCGGSHTMLTDGVARAKADPALRPAPARRYIGLGSDGKCYRFEEGLAPCEECNWLLQHEHREGGGAPTGDGAGDQGTRYVSDSDHNETGVFEVQERRVTVFDDNIERVTVLEDNIRRGSAVDKKERLSQVKLRQIVSMMGSEYPTHRRGTMVGINVQGRPSVVDEEVVQRLAVARDIADRRVAGGGEQVK